MDFCASPSLLAVDQALEKMMQAILPVTHTETVSIEDALDRVLAIDIYSAIQVPSHNNSAMDGYALAPEQGALLFKMVGESLAGKPFTQQLNPGECVKITTGATIPSGADRVVIQENIQIIDEKIVLKEFPAYGENIRSAGEDIALNTLVFTKGHRISPVDIGLLASLGTSSLLVYCRLRVAILSTGDELTPAEQPLVPGNIYDSNRHMLCALLRRLDVELTDLGLLPDNVSRIKATLAQASNEVDLIISTGGVSVGSADFTKDALTDLGEIHFWKIAMKPGKPFAFGKLEKCWFFGLPGNPVSAIVTFHQLVLPSLRHLAGEVFTPTKPLAAVAAIQFKKQPGRTDYQRGILTTKNNINYVTTTGLQSSGMLSSMMQANCYIILEQDRGNVKAGEVVQVLPFDKWIS